MPKPALKSWSKAQDDGFIYGLTVYDAKVVIYWYETPRDTMETKTTVRDFLSGNLNSKVSQYLGNDTLEEILRFLKRTSKAA